MSSLMLRTTIRPAVKRWAFIKGCVCAAAGLGMVWLGELALPWLGVESDALVWLVRVLALGTGWFPFLNLSNGQKHPNLLYADNEKISLYKDTTALFALPWSEVAAFSYLDKGSTYGLAFILKSPQAFAEALYKGSTPHELPLLIEGLETIAKKENSPTMLPARTSYTLMLPEPLVARSRNSYGVDLFLPYFSEPSYQLLKQWREETISP